MSKILPTNFYSVDNDRVQINIGPYKGVVFTYNNIRISNYTLTESPQLCYDYKIINPGNHNFNKLNIDKSFSRLVAAIILDESEDYSIEFLNEPT